MPWNETGTITFCVLAELAAAFDDAKRCALLYKILLPAASHFTVLAFAAAFRGSVARELALLAGTLGRPAEAATHFEFALHQNARVGALPFVVQTQYDYGRFLLHRANAGGLEKAEALFSDALRTATRLQLVHLRDKLLAVQSELQQEATAQL